MLEYKPKPTSKHTHKGLTTEETQLINVRVCVCGVYGHERERETEVGKMTLYGHIHVWQA